MKHSKTNTVVWRATDLLCEYLSNPLGIDERYPRLSWRAESDRRGARQTAWRVRVASDPRILAEGGANLWDSGRVDSDQSAHVVYAGRPLESRDQCFWAVTMWDEAGNEATSEPAFWSMGLLEPEAWLAHWISADPRIIERDGDAQTSTRLDPGTPGLFRKEFDVEGTVRRATAYVSARGLVELQLDGRRVGDDLFAPEWTDYDKRIHFRTYDITSLIRPGRNAVGAVLGDGWWSGYVGWQETRGRYGLENSFLVQVEIELESGERKTVVTDESWTCDTGPILSSDFMMGEVYDARREQDGWSRPGFDDDNWLPAKLGTTAEVPLVAQRSEPVRITETLEPVSQSEIEPGVHIYDLGQNITGWVRLNVDLPAGTQITIRHGERLSPDGTLYTENLRRAKATDVYTCRGGGEEVWQPHFTFHGFQYVELTGLPAAPAKGALTGCVVHSATPTTGHFECSHPGVNRLWLNGAWSQRDNFLSVPTDCPQRDERLGWMGDAQVFSRTASYNMNVAAFFTKWMVDVEDAQTANGIFPDVAPRLKEDDNFVGLGSLAGGAGWADAGVIIPWTIWRVYGDSRIVERHWTAMVKWLDYLERTNPEGIRRHELANNYGDWLCIPSDTSFGTHSPMKTLLATAYWADDAAKMAAMAKAFGKADEAKRFTAMFEKVRDAFQKEFLLEDGRLSVETQTAYLLALGMDLLPEAVRKSAAERLVANIRDLDWHLSTGFIGISHLNPILTLTGHADVAYRLLLQETYPSWLYPVNHGATTIWERWNGWTEEDGFFNPHMNSFNHYSLGSIGEWFFRHVAGIEVDPDHPGFQRFVLRPYPGKGLSFARGSYRTQYGEIVSGWEHADGRLRWEVKIPPNSSAQVWIPVSSTDPVIESGKPLEEAAGIRVLGHEDGWLRCEAAAGTYQFVSEYSNT